jgi:hypothetical protein
MSAMSRIARVRLILVVAALLTLIAVPMAGARTVGSPAVHPAGDSWIGAAVQWAEGLIGLPHSGRPVPPPPNRKDNPDVNKPTGGGCIDPQGRPFPFCF